MVREGPYRDRPPPRHVSHLEGLGQGQQAPEGGENLVQGQGHFGTVAPGDRLLGRSSVPESWWTVVHHDLHGILGDDEVALGSHVQGSGIHGHGMGGYQAHPVCASDPAHRLLHLQADGAWMERGVGLDPHPVREGGPGTTEPGIGLIG